MRGLLFFGLLSTNLLAGEPDAIYLTWRDDPRSTMMINWITEHNDDDDDIEYRESSCPTCEFRKVRGTHKRLNVNNDYQVHRVNINGLKSGTSYTFRLETHRSNEYNFLTMADNLDTPTKFIIGGDIYSDSLGDDRDALYTEMNKLAASYDPFCVFLGGDLSYAGNNPDAFKYWIRWFNIWWKTMRGTNNRLIPMVTAVGNHEIEDGNPKDPSKLLYFDFFPALNNVAYYKLNFGSTMSMLILDSDNVSPINGSQKSWLNTNLQQEANRDHLFALYHHPAYPSVRSLIGPEANKIRQHWSPLFEKYGLDNAFEHHEHSYKRTYPIKAGRRADGGIVYVGDGAWGVEPRALNPVNKAFFEKAQSERHFILMELQEKTRNFKAISWENKVIDQWSAGASVESLGKFKKLDIVH
jgi:hypothetical protein